MERSERKICKGELALTALDRILRQEMARTDLPAFILNFKVQLGIAPRKLTDHGNTPPYRDVEVKKKKKIKQDH